MDAYITQDFLYDSTDKCSVVIKNHIRLCYDYFRYFVTKIGNANYYRNNKRFCCVGWNFYDCVTDAAYSHCPKVQAEYVDSVVALKRTNFSGEFCNKIDYNLTHCYVPFWAIIVIVLGTFFIIGLTTHLACRFYRKRYKSETSGSQQSTTSTEESLGGPRVQFCLNEYT